MGVYRRRKILGEIEGGVFEGNFDLTERYGRVQKQPAVVCENGREVVRYKNSHESQGNEGGLCFVCNGIISIKNILVLMMFP